MSEFSRLRKKAGLSIQAAAEKFGYTQRTVYRWENGESRPRKAVLDSLYAQKGETAPPKYKFEFIDLFAGIGGLRRGFDDLGGKCVFTSEWDRFSQQTYRANFDDDHEIAGDIQEIDEKDIPGHDLLLAGFPCQPFSIAGVSKKNALNRPHGFACEAQGTLFFDVARIIAHHNPVHFYSRT